MNEIEMKVKHIKFGNFYYDGKNCPLANAAKEFFGNKFISIRGTDQIDTTEGIFTVSPKYPITDYYTDRAAMTKWNNDEDIIRTFKLVN